MSIARRAEDSPWSFDIRWKDHAGRGKRTLRIRTGARLKLEARLKPPGSNQTIGLGSRLPRELAVYAQSAPSGHNDPGFPGRAGRYDPLGRGVADFVRRSRTEGV